MGFTMRTALDASQRSAVERGTSRPSAYDSFIHNTLPVLTGALESLARIDFQPSVTSTIRTLTDPAAQIIESSPDAARRQISRLRKPATSY
jgi:hypothetical protein